MTREFSAEARNWLINYHGSIDATALLLAFDAGAQSRDAEVERLTTQLQVAQATIEKARVEGESIQEQFQQGDSLNSVIEILSRTDLSTLVEHDAQLVANVLKNAGNAVPGSMPGRDRISG